jgi:hypothetical protein
LATCAIYGVFEFRLADCVTGVSAATASRKQQNSCGCDNKRTTATPSVAATSSSPAAAPLPHKNLDYIALCKVESRNHLTTKATVRIVISASRAFCGNPIRTSFRNSPSLYSVGRHIKKRRVIQPRISSRAVCGFALR